MAIRPVRLYGDPVLREKAVAVTNFDDTLRQLVTDLKETMHAYNGVGLAANQVGVKQRVLVVSVPLDEGERVELTLVNPTVVERSGSEDSEEGCLSIPGVYEDVSRAFEIRVRAADASGRVTEIEAEGYLARALQHEIDHLEGVLFIDRLSPLRRQFLRRTLDGIARGELPEGYRPPNQFGGPA